MRNETETQPASLCLFSLLEDNKYIGSSEMEETEARRAFLAEAEDEEDESARRERGE